MFHEHTCLSDRVITELCSNALSCNTLVPCAQLVDFAEQHLANCIIESSLGWRNLAIIAQLSRCAHSPALALAEELAHSYFDCVDNEYDIAMRDMVLAEAGGRLDLLTKHLDFPGNEALYVASRGSHLAAEQLNVRFLGCCVERLSEFGSGDWENNNPHLNWRIGCALQAKVANTMFDQHSICSEARQSGNWPRYCRMITEILGPNETAVCVKCMNEMYQSRKWQAPSNEAR